MALHPHFCPIGKKNTREMENIKKNSTNFIQYDVRLMKGNFLLPLLKKAKTLSIGEGITVIQNFEPIPLYSTMEHLGFTYETRQIPGGVYEVDFIRTEIKEGDATELPLKPIVMPRYADIDNAVADLTVNFWDNIWNKENPAIELKTKLLLSLSNAVGLGRLRQATRELIKAYYLGITVKELDELFALFIWNQGIGHFSSELAPSSLFKVYLTIKNAEKKGLSKKEIMEIVTENFGEKNKETGFQK